MHTLQLKIDDSIFDKFMGLLDILPKDKVSFSTQSSDTVSFEEAKIKVQNSINNISHHEGIKLDDAFDRVLNS